jgi:hypothetical protein
MDQESTSPEPEPPEVKPKRRRRTKAEMQSSLPPYDASLVEMRMHVTMKEVIRTGQYESIDVMVHVETERDPRFGAYDNMEMLSDMCRAELQRTANIVRAQIQVEK